MTTIITTTAVDDLCDDMINEILYLCDLRTLMACSLTCKRWASSVNSFIETINPNHIKVFFATNGSIAITDDETEFIRQYVDYISTRHAIIRADDWLLIFNESIGGFKSHCPPYEYIANIRNNMHRIGRVTYYKNIGVVHIESEQYYDDEDAVVVVDDCYNHLSYADYDTREYDTIIKYNGYTKTINKKMQEKTSTTNFILTSNKYILGRDSSGKATARQYKYRYNPMN